MFVIFVSIIEINVKLRTTLLHNLRRIPWSSQRNQNLNDILKLYYFHASSRMPPLVIFVRLVILHACMPPNVIIVNDRIVFDMDIFVYLWQENIKTKNVKKIIACQVFLQSSLSRELGGLLNVLVKFSLGWFFQVWIYEIIYNN